MSTNTVTSERVGSKNAAQGSAAARLHIEPYLFFDGRCEEAIEFYQRAIGAKVEMLMRFKDSPDPNACAPVGGDKVMHASIRIGDSLVLASDGRCENKMSFQGFSLSITATDEKNAE